jgi:hypothetical protein
VLVSSKLEAISLEYNHLLATQLDSQRQYFEGLLAQQDAKQQAAVAAAKAAAEQAQAASQAAAGSAKESERKRQQLERKLVGWEGGVKGVGGWDGLSVIFMCCRQTSSLAGSGDWGEQLDCPHTPTLSHVQHPLARYLAHTLTHSLTYRQTPCLA